MKNNICVKCGKIINSAYRSRLTSGLKVVPVGGSINNNARFDYIHEDCYILDAQLSKEHDWKKKKIYG